MTLIKLMLIPELAAHHPPPPSHQLWPLHSFPSLSTCQYIVVLPSCWSSLHFEPQISPVYFQPLLNHPSYLLPIPILLGTLNLFLLLLRVLAVFIILILLYKLWWFPSVLMSISEVAFFSPVQLFEMFHHQICDFLPLSQTSSTPSSIRMQFLCLFGKDLYSDVNPAVCLGPTSILVSKTKKWNKVTLLHSGSMLLQLAFLVNVPSFSPESHETIWVTVCREVSWLSPSGKALSLLGEQGCPQLWMTTRGISGRRWRARSNTAG